MSGCYSRSEDYVNLDITKKGYRLPTEAEWEYACRTGTTTVYYWGDEMDGNYCWYCDNSGEQIRSSGQKKPNAWGLYDMSGNVWEWCSDCYGDYSSDYVKNPAGPATGSYRVFRGGSFFDLDGYCRSAFRNFNLPGYCFFILGFRLSKSVQ